jgi:putative ABC transport system permease protein
LARHFFPATSALGATIPFNDTSLTVVGVVEQARLYDVHEDGRPQLYLRAEDWGYRSLFYVLRLDRDPQEVAARARAAIRAIDPRLAVASVKTMDEVVGESLRQQRTSALLVAAFATGSLLLAAMGLYAIVSGAVTRRRHELAVRLALGADHGRLLRLLVVEGVRVVALGVLIGVPGVYAAGGLVRGVLVGVSPWDPVTLVSVAVGMALVALIACYVPARRAFGIPPAASLR